ncbi:MULTISPECIES: ABC transporter ATP-binding protein [Methylobacterium]|jgi:peptide/nickel transport system ATP-binding protein|uniref:ABC transporter ATP-binding protein n=1 Tax=Methylobacterium TaxID=407 RepID=UPI0008E75905|nr:MULTISPECIES: ABC transporter ATP-binding protein [Methylobacterium]MBZ6413444.1 ABC transporter ATP-binding protein [Methylobacterium sp.]MBK3397930.1 ABC transporter ATP-binding protein [Methylobacterium ajmalii]MBK3408820.1 ABC transporter ATP-binding protein [Methylobacterium ajmalii]MBK3423836.1 ABC transporter ATP-binding protein [Methylobacterium ajmalii]SFE84470.1 peptide/nickel transport system ATP-binding protein [Methylobacterium sp. yr596]
MSDLLAIEHLSVRLPPGADRSHALSDVSLTLAANEILCVVGESGSGKSVLANTVMRLLPPGVRPDGGAVLFRGRDLVGASEAEMRRLRGAKIGMIFQEPMTALNPLRRAGDQIAETFRIHTKLGARAIRDKTLALLDEVRMPDPAAALRAYPHELSGGQRQRVMIAMALALEPALLIADEPTTALDVTTQGRILALIREIQARRGMGVLFITHDFGVVAEIADRVAVMQAGRLVEEGPAEAVLDRPQAPYTRALIGAVPPLLPRAPRPGTEAAPILTVAGVSKTYRKGGGLLAGLLPGRARVTHAVRDVSLSLPRGTTLGIVGESGSGKSTLARCIVRLLDPETGTIRLGDTDLASLSRRAMRAEARRVQMVFQDPFASLNPRRRAGELVAQGPMLHGVSRADAMAKARELFGLVGLDPAAMDRLPHEFSGGQRQRIGLARALALEPELLVADEPVSALDVSVQAQVLALLDRLRDRLGLSMLFITHDLRVAGQICDRIAVMKDGQVVEAGPTAEVFSAPQAAYTRALLDAVPGRAWIPGRPEMPVV